MAKLASAQADAEAVRAAAEAALNNAKAAYQQAQADATAEETEYNKQQHALELEKLQAEYEAAIAKAKKEAALADQKAWENVDQHIQNVYSDYTLALGQIHTLNGELINKEFELAKADIDIEAAQAAYNRTVATYNQTIANKTAQIERLKSLNLDKAALETQLNTLAKNAYDLMKSQKPAAEKATAEAKEKAEDLYYPIDLNAYNEMTTGVNPTYVMEAHERLEWAANAPAYILAIDTLQQVEKAYKAYYASTTRATVAIVDELEVDLNAPEGCPGSTNPNNDKVGTYALVEGSAYLDATQKIDRYFAEIIKAKQDYIGTPSVTSGSTTTPASGTLYPRKESAEQDKKQHEANLAAEKAETTPDPAEIARLEKLIENDNVAIMAAQEAIDNANEDDADLIILELDTPGGLLSSALSIKNYIIESKVPVAVYINKNALSAGALISLSAKEIYMSDGSVIGAATPIYLNGNETKKASEKGGYVFMRCISLNHDELMIIGCFYEGSKEETILLLEDTMNVLKEVRMDESDDEMIQLLETAIEKLKKMDEATFASLDLQKYLNDLQEDQKND